jgi:hypothetical protein
MERVKKSSRVALSPGKGISAGKANCPEKNGFSLGDWFYLGLRKK